MAQVNHEFCSRIVRGGGDIRSAFVERFDAIDKDHGCISVPFCGTTQKFQVDSSFYESFMNRSRMVADTDVA